MKSFLRSLYKLVPFKKEIFTVLKKIWKPSRSVYRHLHFKGIFNARLKNAGQFRIMSYGYQVENEIFWAGLENGWEKESMKLWMPLCKRSKVIFDIGANTGVYSLIAKTINPAASVFAFEPVSRVFQKLQSNIQLNNYDISAHEKAVSDKDGEAIIYDLPTEHVYSVTVNKNMTPTGTKAIETRIQTVSLDTFIRTNSLQHIDLMKIDVETHEPEVLEGFKYHLAQFMPTILIEILNDEIGRRVEDAVNGLGYLYFNIDETNGIRLVEHITKSDYYNFLLCTPQIATELGIYKVG